MSDAARVHAEQLAYWRGSGGERWAAGQVHLDAMLAPVGEAVIAYAAPGPEERVLDIGCGGGATALALAARVTRGHVTGLDVSPPLIDLARKRSAGHANITWLCADAATHPFAPETFDLLFSRFGVMFFGDPPAAFANLRRATRPDGCLVFACWQAQAENAWMRVLLEAVAPLLPPAAAPAPGAPGPFAFADPDHVARILIRAGWSSPRFEARQVAIDLAAGGGIDAAAAYATRIGGAARVLAGQTPAVREAAEVAIRNALAPYATPDGRVPLPGAVWLVSSTRD